MGRFNQEEANFLAHAAASNDYVTYGEFAAKFGGIANGQGKKLTEMGERMHANNLPLLPVLVVNKQTNLPSGDAEFYKRLGIGDVDAIRTEQQKCFAYDWTTTPFWNDLT